jgi:signal transduction histidine kinase
MTSPERISDRTPYPLDRPLPTEVVAGGGVFRINYRRYPVFGWPWLRGRVLIFAIGIALWALLTGVGLGMTTSDAKVGILSGLHFFIGFMLMACAGPLLATIVRHRELPLRRERIGVVAAVSIGIVVAYFADTWASGYLEQVMPKTEGIDVTVKPPTFSAFTTAVLATVKVVIGLLVYGALGGGLALRAYFGELRRWQDNRQADALAALELRKQQSELRLGVLQAQVEPHFLFNTLASVRALLRQDPMQAEATLDALVDYLRATIPKLRDEDTALHSTLGQQLDLCTSYLELMRLRTAGRLDYRIDVDDALRALPCPPMLLISLVENAVKHGVEPKPGPGTVTIAAERRERDLHISVIDDGLGLRLGVGGGLGLANVRAQLDTRYGARAGFQLTGEPACGTRAELRLPLDDPSLKYDSP